MCEARVAGKQGRRRATTASLLLATSRSVDALVLSSGAGRTRHLWIRVRRAARRARALCELRKHAIPTAQAVTPRPLLLGGCPRPTCLGTVDDTM
jgi:hypothetical protein